MQIESHGNRFTLWSLLRSEACRNYIYTNTPDVYFRGARFFSILTLLNPIFMLGFSSSLVWCDCNWNCCVSCYTFHIINYDIRIWFSSVQMRQRVKCYRSTMLNDDAWAFHTDTDSLSLASQTRNRNETLPLALVYGKTIRFYLAVSAYIMCTLRAAVHPAPWCMMCVRLVLVLVLVIALLLITQRYSMQTETGIECIECFVHPI